MTKLVSETMNWLRSPWRWVSRRIQRKLMLTYLLVMIIPLGLSAQLIYREATNIVSEQTEKNNYKLLQLMNERIDQFISKVDQISYFVYLDDVQTLLNERPSGSAASLAAWRANLTNKFHQWSGFMGFQGGIRGVALIDANGEFNSIVNGLDKTGAELKGADWYEAALNQEGKPVMIGMQELGEALSFAPHRANSLNFAIARKVHNLAGKEPLGVLVMAIEFGNLNGIIDEMGLDGSTGLVIVGRLKDLLYRQGTDRSLTDEDLRSSLAAMNDDCTGFANGSQSRLLVNSFQSSMTNWCYVTMTDKASLSEEATNLNRAILLFGVLGLALALLISLLFSRRIVVPIKRLQVSMANIIKHNFRSKIPVSGTDEVSHLTETFNFMTNRIRELIQTVYQVEIKEKEANLNALQAQINPHFLYNTLGTINAMAVVENQEEIGEMVVALGDMLQYAIRTKDKIVTIRDELTHVSCYITIQKTRFGSRLQYSAHVPEGIADNRLIRLSLQPLVENAISHGIERGSGAGSIQIIGKRAGDAIEITVSDDGAGIPEERLRDIQAWLSYQKLRESEERETSIGLYNVNERLKLHFGEAYGITIRSEWGKGTEVTIRIPAEPLG